MQCSHPTRSAWAATLALLAAATLALAACGGSGTAASTPPSPSPSSTIPSLQDLQPTGSDSTLSVTIPTADASFSELKTMFAYDRSEPLSFDESGAAGWGGARNRLIEYVSAGCTVTGSLAIPRGTGPFPVVVMAAPGSYALGYDEQVAALSRAGVAVLGIDSPDVRDPYLDMEGIEQDAERYIRANVRYIVDLRRALDLIETQPKLDDERIGYVGWSWTGALGALLAGIDPRVKAYVLDYAGGTNRGLEGLVGEVQDPAEYIAHNRGSAFLFQYTREDTDSDVFSRARVAEFVAAAPEPKTFQWVKGAHGALFESAESPGCRYLLGWLEKNL